MIARSLARDRTYLVWYTAYSRVDLSLVSSSAPGVQKNRLKDSAACCVFFIFPSVHFKFQNSKNKSGFLPSKQQNSRTAKQTVRGRPPKHTNHPHAPRVSRSRKEKRSTAREGLDAGKSKVAGAGWGVIGWHVYSSCRAQCFAFVLAFHQHIHTYIGTSPQKAPGSRTAVAHRPCTASISDGNGSLGYLLCFRWSLVYSLLFDVLYSNFYTVEQICIGSRTAQLLYAEA